MLIDDDKATNFLHSKTIKDVDKDINIIIKYSVYDALDFLKKSEESLLNSINLILLDINLPGLDGWDFLMEYNKLDLNIKVSMLTTSNNPNDRLKAEEFGVNFFLVKPLTAESFLKTLES